MRAGIVYVVGSLKKCIRCAVLCDVNKNKNRQIIYILQNAKVLRPDLTNKEKRTMKNYSIAIDGPSASEKVQ